LLASASDDLSVRIWNVSDGSLLQTLNGHTDIVRSVAFAPDGALLASIADDRTLRLWQVSDGSLVQTIQYAPSSDYVYAADIAFSPDGRLLAPVSSQGVGLWQISDGAQLFPSTSSASRVSFAQDGKLLVTVSSSLDSVEFWNIREMQAQPTEISIAPTPVAAASRPTIAPATETPGSARPTVVTATEAPMQATAEPTRTSSPEAQQFFKEEFSSEEVLSSWKSFSLGSGEDTNLVIRQEDDHLLFDLGNKDLYVYYTYTPFEYEDVSIKVNAENLGRNNNNVSLVCRMNPEETQWYEFSVESGGLWYLYAYQGNYHVIVNGGTQALKQGHEINEYEMICKGSQITVFVNGDELQTITESTYAFASGQVGFNISSLNVLPITVAVNWFEIRRP
jgi:WD40 repeat protein